MTTILSFPPELWVLFMTHCDSPIDLSNLINASPHALRRFFVNRRSVLKSHIKAIRATCGSIPAAALLAARLRHARKKEGLGALYKKEAEKKVRSTAIIYLIRSEADTEQFLMSRLAHLCALWTIITEAGWIASQYAPQAWNNYKHLNRTGLLLNCVNQAGTSNDMVLSLDERRKFYRAVFRFESYCQVFFNDEELLFPGNTDYRRVCFEEEASITEDTNTVNNFYSIVYYVYDQYWSLLNNVISHLGTEAARSPNGIEAAEGDYLERQYDFKNRDWVLKQFHLCRFRYRTELDTHKLVHYLVSQGLSTLFHMQRMNIEDLTSITIATFYRVSLSHYSVILMINGVEFYRKELSGATGGCHGYTLTV